LNDGVLGIQAVQASPLFSPSIKTTPCLITTTKKMMEYNKLTENQHHIITSIERIYLNNNIKIQDFKTSLIFLYQKYRTKKLR
jgi:hypothetical protein